MEGNRDSNVKLGGMLEDTVGTGRAMNKKTCSL